MYRVVPLEQIRRRRQSFKQKLIVAARKDDVQFVLWSVLGGAIFAYVVINTYF